MNRTYAEDGAFEAGDIVEVLANKDDPYSDFRGRVKKYKSKGILTVIDQDDNAWDVDENQCEKVG